MIARRLNFTSNDETTQQRGIDMPESAHWGFLEENEEISGKVGGMGF